MSRRSIFLGLAVALLCAAPVLAPAASVTVRLSATIPELAFDSVSCSPQPYDPLRGPLTISFGLSRPSPVLLVITDPLDRIVFAAVVPSQQDGRYRTTWDGKDNSGVRVPSGTYRCTLSGRDSGGNTAGVTQSVVVGTRR